MQLSRLLLVAVTTVAIIVSGCQSTPEPSSAPRISGFIESKIVPAPPGIQQEIGAGYNALIDEKRQFALQGEKPLPLLKSDTGGHAAFSRIQKIESKSSLAKEIDFSAEASYGGFGSAEMALVSKTKVNSYSLRYLLNARVLNPPRVLGTPRLSDQAVALLKNRRYLDFYQLYGTHFYASEIRGGTFYVVINVLENEREQERSLNAKMKANIGLFGTSAELKSALSKSSKSYRLNISSSYSGGSSNLPTFFPDIESAEKAASAFTQEIDASRGNDSLLAMRVEPYQNCINFPLEATEYEGLVSRAVRAAREVSQISLKLADLHENLDQATTDRYMAVNSAVPLRKRVTDLENSGKILKREISEDPFATNILIRLDQFKSDVNGCEDSINTALHGLDASETPLLVAFTNVTLSGWRHLKGDTEMKTKPDRKTYITVSVEPVIKGEKLFLDVEYYAQEGQGDKSKFGGKKQVEITSVPANCRVVRLLPNTPYEFYEAIRGQHHNFVGLPTKESLLSRVAVKFDGPGGEDRIAIKLSGAIHLSTVCK